MTLRAVAELGPESSRGQSLKKMANLSFYQARMDATNAVYASLGVAMAPIGL
jgi:hypothetical protein